MALFWVLIGLLFDVLHAEIEAFNHTKIITKQKQLNNDGDFQEFVFDSTLFEYWLYNITNPFEASTGAIPQMQSLGPFVYKRSAIKSDIEFSENDTIVSYTYIYQYEYQPQRSIPIPLNQYIWTISELFCVLHRYISLFIPWIFLNILSTWNSLCWSIVSKL